MERLSASIQGGAGGAPFESGGRWLPGVGGSMSLVVPHDGPLSVFIGGTSRFLTGGTSVRVDGQRVASFPARSFGVTLGVELALDALFGLDRD
jgi:hypothetical protein